LGQALAATGKTREAIRPYRRAIRLAESLGEIRLAAQISNNLGNAYRQAGDFRRARATFVRAIEGARAVGDHELECTARGNLGLAEFELGRYPQAEIELRESIACAQTLGSKRLEAGHAGDLGNVYRATGRLTEAEACYRQALALARVIGDQKYEEIGLGDLGILLFQMGRTNEAIALLEEARALGESISALADAARDAYHLSTIYRELSDGPAEEATLHECLRLAEAADEVSLKEGVLWVLAYRAMGARDWASAEEYLRQADEVASSLADAYNAWTAPFAWGFLAYQQEKYDEAERRWEEAYRLAEDAGNIYGALGALINRGSVLNMLRRAAEGESLLREALQRDHAGAREGYERARGIDDGSPPHGILWRTRRALRTPRAFAGAYRSGSQRVGSE
jgi:tetratricopeptide (TPR) repeat protein